MNEKRLVNKYKKQIEDGTFKLNIKWERDINLIDLKKPKTKIVLENFPENWEMADCNLSQLISMIFKNGGDEFYPIQNPFKNSGDRTPENIAKLFEFVESGEMIYPPIINFIPRYQSANPHDGNHRIGMARANKDEKIPIIFEKKHRAYLEAIALIETNTI